MQWPILRDQTFHPVDVLHALRDGELGPVITMLNRAWALLAAA